MLLCLLLTETDSRELEDDVDDASNPTETPLARLPLPTPVWLDGFRGYWESAMAISYSIRPFPPRLTGCVEAGKAGTTTAEPEASWVFRWVGHRVAAPLHWQAAEWRRGTTRSQ